MTESKTKPAKDPTALKIASFRTKEGVWAEFCNKAEAQGLTATDVLKAAMEQFINGEYQPSSQYHNSIMTRDDVVEIANTVVSTLSISTDKRIDNVMTVVHTSFDELTDKLTALELEVSSIKKFYSIGPVS